MGLVVSGFCDGCDCLDSNSWGLFCQILGGGCIREGHPDNEKEIGRKIQMKLENKNPTNTEKVLFKYYGLYLVERKEWSIRYAPVHIDCNREEFPFVIDNIQDELIEWDNDLTFDLMSETVSINSFYDIDGITLIMDRMEELGFKRAITATTIKQTITSNNEGTI